MLKDTIPCLLPLAARQSMEETRINNVPGIYTANLTRLPRRASLGFDLTPAQVVSLGAQEVCKSLNVRRCQQARLSGEVKPSAKEVLIGGLVQAKGFYNVKNRRKELRLQDSLQILLATAAQCSSVLMRESEEKKRESLKGWSKTHPEESTTIFQEGILFATMASEMKKSISEAKRLQRDRREMHRYLLTQLEKALEELLI